jgi:predicted ArsR family transcriptional regulator
LWPARPTEPGRWRPTATDDDGPGTTGTADDPVLDKLRRRGTATVYELAGALGGPPDAVRALLRALVAAGTVEPSGHAPGTRYHAW